MNCISHSYRFIFSSILLYGLFFTCLQTVYAQDSASAAQNKNWLVADADLPPEVVAKFNIQYPNAVGPTWIRNFNYFEVKFTLKGRTLFSSYSSVGEWVKTEIMMNAEELPPFVTQYMLEYDPEAVVQSAKVDITPIGKIFQVKTSRKTEEVWLYYDIKGFFLKAVVVNL